MNNKNPFNRGPGIDLSKKLIEKENEDAIKATQELIGKHIAKMTKVVADINQILVDNELSWMDWGEIVKMFNDRNTAYFNKVLISTINNNTHVHKQPGATTGGETIEQRQEGA